MAELYAYLARDLRGLKIVVFLDLHSREPLRHTVA
jgi:hypothetical protein